MRSKISQFIILLLLVSVSAGLSYLLYMNYQKFITVKSEKVTTEKIENIFHAFKSLENEKKLSAELLSRSAKDHRKQLTEIRKDTDRYLSDEKLGEDVKSWLIKIKNDLKYLRANVDTLHGEYIDAVGDNYTLKIENELFKILYRLSSGYTDQRYRDLIKISTQFMEAASGISSERAYLTFILNINKPLSIKDMAFWEKLIEYERDPLISGVKDPKLLKELKKIIDDTSSISNKSLILSRGYIIEHSTDGDYGLYGIEKLKPFISIESGYSKGTSSILDKIKQNTDIAYKKAEQNIAIYIAITLLSILILIIYLRNTSSNRQELIALENLIKDMMDDMSPKQRGEFERVLKKGDKIAIYKLLAQVTKEAHDAKEMALEAEKAKDAFLANMSHELRTPLNGIIGFTQMLKETKLTDEQRGYVETVSGSSQNLLGIVNSILDLSKIKANKIELEHILFSPAKEFHDTIEAHESICSEKKIGYTAYIDPGLPRIVGDPLRLKQIMTNLIGNAVKFTKKGGSVDIDIVKTEENDTDVTVRFSVKDTGIGITPEQKEKIFEAFSQADVSTTRQFGGTGLGLTITKDLISQMGGELDLHSEAGKGTEFFFTLTFKKGVTDENISHNLHTLKIGYYLPQEGEIRRFDDIMLKYCSALSKNILKVKDLDSSEIEKLDILIIDHYYIRKHGDISIPEGTKTKIVVTGHVSHKKSNDMLIQKHVSTLYKPITYYKFVKYLDMLMSEDTASNKKQQRVSEGSNLKGMKILVAEDNMINRNLLKALLKDTKAELTMVENGLQAVEERRKYDYDIILMDIQMPVMGGIQATQTIIEMERDNGWVHVPIIAVTANAQEEERKKYLDIGMDDYLSKPVNIEQLRKLLYRYYISTRKLEDNNINEEIKESDRKGSNILLFGRHGIFCKIHEKSFSDDGYHLDIVNNHEDFIKAASEYNYDVVIIHAAVLESGDCETIESLKLKGSKIFINTTGEESPCNERIHTYDTIKELKEKIS